MKQVTWGLFVVMMLSVFWGFTSGCSGGAQSKKLSSLHTNIKTFHNALRTGRYHEASRYLKRSEQEEFVGRYEELGDDFEIVEIEAKVVDIERDGKIARAESEVRWFRLPEMTVHKDKVTETWNYVGDNWVLMDREVKPAKQKVSRSATKKRVEKTLVTLP